MVIMTQVVPCIWIVVLLSFMIPETSEKSNLKFSACCQLPWGKGKERSSSHAWNKGLRTNSGLQKISESQ